MVAITEQTEETDALPVLPLLNGVPMPGREIAVELARAGSIAAVRRANAYPLGDPRHNRLLVAAQPRNAGERPLQEDLHPVVVLGRLIQISPGLPGRMSVTVALDTRAKLLHLQQVGPYAVGTHDVLAEDEGDPVMSGALARAVKDLLGKYDELLPRPEQSDERAQDLQRIVDERDPARVADCAAGHLDLEVDEMLALLSELDVAVRLKRVLDHVSHGVQTLRVQRDIDMTVRDHLSRHEHEALLRHKMRAIQRELAENETSPQDELALLHERIDRKDLGSFAREAAERELRRLAKMNPESGEATIARTYVEWLAELPWGDAEAEAERIDLEDARAKLEAGHHGLDRVKRRVIEHLAVRKLVPNKRGPILCFAGPPGVGKTSLGRAIADTLGRPFVRLSLGGVRDDAELRGHRRTYVGAQPGRFLQAMKRAGRSNPVFLLDEVDKVAQSPGRGDPIGVLLEALDPEQNDAFEDHYLGVPYDLSRVSFICTANELGAIPAVLRDRLEIIEIGGYTIAEKMQIARDHLIPKIRTEHGFAGENRFDVSDETLELIATRYTRESGVRGLQRKLEALVRDHAMQIAERGDPDPVIAAAECMRILGPPPYSLETQGDHPRPGVVTGLGWTPTGGRLLFIEATRTPGKGRLRLTGRLGDVMKESGQAALSLIRSDPARFGSAVDLQTTDVHVHLPAGAVPKDGPSAGVGLVTALASSISNRPVRTDLAMTGEVTLRGQVLPVGGVREKVLAAHRAGIRHIVLPEGNRKDEPEIPEAARAELTLHYVRTVDEVVALALVPVAAA